ncbi:O-antigen polymerase [Providencia rettgeri]|uniref:O-antigen polymerase n=2 Tax=Providencia rettgeri TaxID=587 RepID=UPI001B389F5E|nr:O-antigen polymerase [Providencia rettgeri]ELR5092554.1 oligosaccharide repeat unit polymerase [Providencia rettgeri]ELR5106396.1 oligosaccharide repeat unit polymerase [Providencia rettgeri]MBQ0608568.1 oligosaccharide repeat unit polymerase [Providencia rettgeri]MCB4816130.1 oligosaccharide repeat unit polymerase [Providencia rettgeri]MCJ2288662.1 oligosaccharide repeat unit polymerase [Providencia rettgeri]
MNKIILSAIILLLIFFWLFPLVEFLFFDNQERSHDLGIFVLSQTLSLIVAFLFCIPLSFFKIRASSQNLFFNNEIYISRITFFISTLLFSLFLIFYLNNLNGIYDIFSFAERYRNGLYSGSGIYTAGMLQFLPIALSLLIVKCKKINKYILFSLFLLMLTSFLLGLRIFLLIVLFFLMIRLMNSPKKKLAFILIGMIFSFFVSYKMLLADDLSEQSLDDILLHIAGRIRYRFLIYDSNFSYDLDEFLGFIAYPLMPSIDSLADWKESFALSIPNLMKNMPFISLYSGIAFPLPIIIFNVFGLLGFVFIFPIIIIFVWSLKRLYETNSITKSIWYLYGVYFTFSILIEDIYQFSKIPLMIILMVVVNLYFLLLQRKNKI